MNTQEVCPKCNNTRVIQENVFEVKDNGFGFMVATPSFAKEMPCNWCRVQEYREAIVNHKKKEEVK